MKQQFEKLHEIALELEQDSTGLRKMALRNVRQAVLNTLACLDQLTEDEQRETLSDLSVELIQYVKDKKTSGSHSFAEGTEWDDERR